MKRGNLPLSEIAAVAPPRGSSERPADAAAPQPVQSPGQAPPVLYIAGSGRSGSTLLERLLGEMPGFVNVGELIDLFRGGIARGDRCGCGLPVASCPFWTAVAQRAFGGWETTGPAAVHSLQARVARQRWMPRLLAMRMTGQGFKADVAAYGQHYESLYRAIAAEAGVTYVVDASKWPVQALALGRAGLDVRVIHLVRDVRGVAYSQNKQQVARPHAVSGTEFMWRNPPARAAARWAAEQSQAELLHRCGIPVTRVRYEDFVRQPRHTIEVALADLGLPAVPSDLLPIGEGRVMLGPSHGLSGNPSRFHDGEIALRADEAWRDQMSRRDRVIVTMIGLPFLLRYGSRHPGGLA